MSSVDGDSPPRLADPDDDEVDGDGVDIAPVRRRGRGRNPRVVPQPAEESFTHIGKAALFFIIACSSGLWAVEFSDMPGLPGAWADTSYGDGAHHFIGVVLGHWEFVDRARADPRSDEESIYCDLACMHNRGRSGIIVYRLLKSCMLLEPPSVEMPVAGHELLSQFCTSIAKVWTGNEYSETAMRSILRDWKRELNIQSWLMHVVDFAPQAAVMALTGWVVFHAVAVSRQMRSTRVIGGDPSNKHLMHLRQQLRVRLDAAVDLSANAQPTANAHSFEEILDWTLSLS